MRNDDAADAADTAETAETVDDADGSSLETVPLDGRGDGSPRTPVFGGDPRAVSLSLAEGESIPHHEHPDETVLLLVREGRATVSVGGTERTLTAGDLARFDGADGVSIDARTDVSALVVLASDGDR